jgi:thiamine-monophosphate kinase
VRIPVKTQKYPSQEYALLKSLEPFLNYTKSTRYPIGIGDDAAVRRSRGPETLIFTADTMAEGVHFSLEYMTLREVGYKAMCVNLSDCAAMGARPDGALAQIIFPGTLSRREVAAGMRAVYEGFRQACIKWNYPIIGGNLSKGPCWIIDITLIGRMEKGARPVMRTGARSGDILWVTGMPGSSAAGLAALRKWGKAARRDECFAGLVRAHIHPIPRLEIGMNLARNPAVHAVIDVSDGIAKECRTIAYDNNVGIVLDCRRLDFPSPMRALAKGLRIDCLQWFLYGGEDYELLFTAAADFNPDKAARTLAVTLTKIGMVTDRVKGVFFKNKNDTMIKVNKASGWDHIG